MMKSNNFIQDCFPLPTRDSIHSTYGSMRSNYDDAKVTTIKDGSSSSSNLSYIPTTPEPDHRIVTKSSVNQIKLKKIYPCSKCPKHFSRPSALETHSYTHTLEKPFQCQSPNCGRKFSVVSNLRRHFKVHQKPSVGLKRISSQDRISCVRQLIKRSSTNDQKPTHNYDSDSNISLYGNNMTENLILSNETRDHSCFNLPLVKKTDTMTTYSNIGTYNTYSNLYEPGLHHSWVEMQNFENSSRVSQEFQHPDNNSRVQEIQPFDNIHETLHMYEDFRFLH